MDPVRGSPMPNNGATICWSPISGNSAYHCSIRSRLTRKPMTWSDIAAYAHLVEGGLGVQGVDQDPKPLPP